MSMREAFDIFFENNNKSWRRTWGTLPRVPRCDKYRQSSLIVAENDKFDELECCPNYRKKGLTLIRWKKIWNLEFTHKLKTF